MVRFVSVRVRVRVMVMVIRFMVRVMDVMFRYG